MRANPLQIIVFAALCSVAPAALARPHKPAAKTGHVHSAHALPAAKVHKTMGKHAKAEPVVERTSRKSRKRRLKHEVVIAKAGKPTPVAAPETVAEPEPAPIHVTHNRKPHLSGPTVELTPRKATSADFLDTFAHVESAPKTSLEPGSAGENAYLSGTIRPFFSPLDRLPLVAAAASPGAVAADESSVELVRTTPKKSLVAKVFAPASGSAAKPVSVVSIIRKTTEKPQILSIEDAVVTPVFLPALYNKRGHLIVPAALKGSHEILLRQNQIADHDGLDRIQDDEDLSRMRTGKLLVAIPAVQGIQTDERLPDNRRYCRPWTAVFLRELARAHYARFHTALQVNSAVRTVEFQQRLLRTNGNAAPADGETASPHLTGQAVDLAKRGLTLTEIAWLRGYLIPLVQQGKIDVEEEFQQACFHISVYRKYVPQTAPKRTIATRYKGLALAALVK